MSYKIKYIITTILILLISCFSCKEKGNDKVSAKSDLIPVKWEKFSNGLKQAEIQQKPVLIFFYTDWCVYCKKMTSEVFEDAEVAQYLNQSFISIKVNPENEKDTIELMGEKISPAKLMSYTGSNAFPTTLFLTSRKKPLTTVPGFIEKKTFLSILKYLKEECYNSKIPLDDYMKNPDLCKAKKN